MIAICGGRGRVLTSVVCNMQIDSYSNIQIYYISNTREAVRGVVYIFYTKLRGYVL